MGQKALSSEAPGNPRPNVGMSIPGGRVSDLRETDVFLLSVPRNEKAHPVVKYGEYLLFTILESCGVRTFKILVDQNIATSVFEFNSTLPSMQGTQIHMP